MMEIITYEQAKGKTVKQIHVRRYDDTLCIIFEDETYCLFSIQDCGDGDSSEFVCYRTEFPTINPIEYNGYKLVEYGVITREEWDKNREENERKYKEKELIRKKEQLAALKKELGEV